MRKELGAQLPLARRGAAVARTAGVGADAAAAAVVVGEMLQAAVAAAAASVAAMPTEPTAAQLDVMYRKRLPAVRRRANGSPYVR